MNNGYGKYPLSWWGKSGLQWRSANRPIIGGEKNLETGHETNTVLHPGGSTMYDKKIQDHRNRRIIFISHCILNQNAKVHGLAKYPAFVKPVVQKIIDNEVAIYQMPCPEMMYYGAMRWGQVRDQYDTPMFRNHCSKLADDVLGMVEEYQRSNYQVLGFVMMDGSPVCGLQMTSMPGVADQTWGGKVLYIPDQICAEGMGVYCKILREKAILQGIDNIPFVAFPEIDAAGTFDLALNRFEHLLKQ